ncbi:MAG: esterase [Gemmatimonadetes bacterium]|nr:esterase [Gemmatimonadota bacterium]
MISPRRSLSLRSCLPPLLSTLGLIAAAHTAPLAAQEALPDAIPPHDTLTVPSRALGEARRINVHTPPNYAASAAARFPVLYMPDGGLDEDFPHVVNTVDSLIKLGAIRPVIVVGVPNTQRRRDLTGPTRVATDSAIAPHVGGSAAFRRFLRDELMPAIDSHYRTTPERAIVGESLAGLFVVETFLREPTLFDHYVAFDPSLWWNRAALVDSAPALLAPNPAARVERRLRPLAVARSISRPRATTLGREPRGSTPRSGRRRCVGSRGGTRRGPTSRTGRSFAQKPQPRSRARSGKG